MQVPQTRHIPRKRAADEAGKGNDKRSETGKNHPTMRSKKRSWGGSLDEKGPSGGRQQRPFTLRKSRGPFGSQGEKSQKKGKGPSWDQNHGQEGGGPTTVRERVEENEGDDLKWGLLPTMGRKKSGNREMSWAKNL